MGISNFTLKSATLEPNMGCLFSKNCLPEDGSFLKQKSKTGNDKSEFQQSTIHLKRKDTTDSWGFTFVASGNDGLLITDVVPGGVADYAGLKIDDNTCTGIDHCEAMNIFESAGSIIKMTILCKNPSNEKMIKLNGQKKIFGKNYEYNYTVDPEFEEYVKAEKEKRCGKCFDCFVFNRIVKFVEWLKPNDISYDKTKEKFSDVGIQDVSKKRNLIKSQTLLMITTINNQ